MLLGVGRELNTPGKALVQSEGCAGQGIYWKLPCRVRVEQWVRRSSDGHGGGGGGGGTWPADSKGL